MPDMLGWFRHWNLSDWMPKGIAKKFAAPVVASGLLSYGLITVSEPPATVYGLSAPPAPCGIVCKSKKWVNRHPAIAGALAGGAAGSVVPGVGTIIGVATGATIGYTIGSDERASRVEDKMMPPA